MVGIARGRFALAISHGGQAKIPGRVTLFALNPDNSLSELWGYPDQDDRRYIESEIYFLKPDRQAVASIAIREHEVVFVGPGLKLFIHEVFYRLNPRTDQFTQSDIDPPRLTKLLDAAERDRQTIHITQRGTIGVGAALELKKKADQHDQALRTAYARLRRELSRPEREKLAAEQKEWLNRRDQIEDLYERIRFVADRVKELKARSENHK
jgi:hypothetical protein